MGRFISIRACFTRTKSRRSMSARACHGSAARRRRPFSSRFRKACGSNTHSFSSLRCLPASAPWWMSAPARSLSTASAFAPCSANDSLRPSPSGYRLLCFAHSVTACSTLCRSIGWRRFDQASAHGFPSTVPNCWHLMMRQRPSLPMFAIVSGFPLRR